MMFSSSALAVAATLASAASAQSLANVLTTNANLTGLSTLLAAYPDLVTSLGSASNITLLAPSNNAITAFLASANSSAAPSASAITALLQYHVLNGTHPRSDFSTNSTFLPSMLTNPTYSNVTGGQRVEGVVSGSRLYFISGNLDNTTVSTADVRFDGGIIHIIDRILTVPSRLGARPITNAGTTVNALFTLLQTTNLLNAVADIRDVTIFAPSDAGLTNVMSTLASLSPEDAANIARYHVVNTNGPYYTPRFGFNQNTTLQAMSGQNLTVVSRRVGGIPQYFVNGARIVGTNWLIGGGVLHVIDNVLNPANRTTFISTPAIPSSSDSGNGTGTSSGSGSSSTARSGASPAQSISLALAGVAALALAL